MTDFQNILHADVVVVGGGHAGCEAALACAKRGFSTLLVTSRQENIAALSCNPSIGGLGKGHLVREIDALGGEMAKNTDETGIQFRKLNTNKGPAVQGTRAQVDRWLYKQRMQTVLTKQSSLRIIEDEIIKFIINNCRINGAVAKNFGVISSRAIILAGGTFLNGVLHFGLRSEGGGRIGDRPATQLSRSLIDDCGLELIRLKTGTVPRLKKDTINFEVLEEQIGDNPLPLFSFSTTTIRQKQISCFLTATNEKTHEIIRSNLDKSPLYQGVIKGTGPRYCPSIEDKIVRFPEKISHHIFLEPEGLTTDFIYPNGLPTSLPIEVQADFIRSIIGLEKAEILQPGYAVEYDAIDPVQLKSSYETKNILGLFLAGQVNGTSGYEEAAAQGLMAGINAAQFCLSKEPVVIPRHLGYVGVLTDDLVTKGVGGEPYRMFTSRAEHRLSLREETADQRLREIGFSIGLITQREYDDFLKKHENFIKMLSFFKKERVRKDSAMLVDILGDNGSSVQESYTLDLVARWPETDPGLFKKYWQQVGRDTAYDENIISLVVNSLRYDGYIKRYQTQIDRMAHYDTIKIPKLINYTAIDCLSNETKAKLTQTRPETLGQAIRIPGITPAAIAHLEIFISRARGQKHYKS